MASQRGLAAIEAMFQRAQAEGRPAFLPFFPLGYPGVESSLDILKTLAALGADGFELGVPFSDPLADGPTIQAASQVALENGVTLSTALAAVHDLRSQGIDQPILLFTYLNPLLAYGPERIAADAAAAGADGFIVPDLPPEELALMGDHAARQGLALVCFVAPTSNPERVRLAAEKASGFLYVLSVTGVTGARSELPAELSGFLRDLRRITTQRLVLGFGISQPDHVAAVRGLVDGFIAGSALVRAAGEGGLESVRALASSLAAAAKSP